MMNLKNFRIDARTIFILVALTGAGSLFVSTLTSDAPEVMAEEPAKPAEHAPEGAAPVADGKQDEKAAEVAAAAPAPTRKKSGCLTGEASVEDFQEMKRELAKKEQELKKREEEIVAKERAVDEELKKLETTRDEIKQAQVVGDSKNEEKISKIVETFESMSPKSASAIVATIDDRLAVEAMSRLSSAKLGKILAAMEPNKSSSLAEKLAGVVRAKKPEARNSASLGAAETSKSVKGGDENGNRKQSNTDAVSSRQPEPALGREPASEKR